MARGFPTLLLAVVALAPTALAEDWPQLLGPRRDNVVRGGPALLDEWPEGGPPRRWRTTGLGPGYSSVAIAGDRLYTMGTRDRQEVVLALRRRDGRVVWVAPTGAEHFDKHSGDGPRSTPTVADGRVHALGAHGDLVCLDTASGRRLWSRRLADDFGGNPARHGARESVLVDGERLACTPGGEEALIVALDPATGEEIWRSENPRRSHEASYASPVAAEIDGVRQYIVFTSEGLVAVRARDGEILWTDDSTSDSENCITPLVRGREIFYSSNGRDGSALLRVRRRGERWEVERVWRNEDLRIQYGEAVRRDDHLYGFDRSHVFCAEWTTGRVRWDSRVRRGDGRSIDRHAVVTLAGDRLIGRGYEGGVVLVEAVPDAFRPRGGFIPALRADDLRAPEAPAYPHPVVHQGLLYLRDQDVLSAYDLRAPDSPPPSAAERREK